MLLCNNKHCVATFHNIQAVCVHNRNDSKEYVCQISLAEDKESNHDKKKVKHHDVKLSSLPHGDFGGL